MRSTGRPAAAATSGPGSRTATFGLGDVLALATVLLWGASFTVIKTAYHEFQPLAFAAVRFVIASAVLVAFMLARGPFPRIARGDLARTAAVGVFHVGLYQIFFGVGLQYTTASNSVLIINTAPAATALLVWLSRSERITLRQVVGMLLAAAGIVILTQAGGKITAGSLKGDVLTLLAAWSYAAAPVVILPLYRRYSTLAVMTISMLFGTALIIASAIPELLRQSWAVSPAAWGQLLYAAIGAGTIGYVFWYEGIRRIGPTRAAAYSYLIAPVGVLTAISVLHEPFGLGHLLGAIVTIAGVAMTRWPASRGNVLEPPRADSRLRR